MNPFDLIAEIRCEFEQYKAYSENNEFLMDLSFEGAQRLIFESYQVIKAVGFEVDCPVGFVVDYPNLHKHVFPPIRGAMNSEGSGIGKVTGWHMPAQPYRTKTKRR